MSKRSLAHVERVHNIRPIDGADRIEQISILGWNLVTLKGEFKDGDLAVYVEIDSRVPSDMECFKFLEARKYKIKSIKIRKTISQGIAFPLSILPEGNYAIGDDVTDILGIKKIEEDEYKIPQIDNISKLKSSHKKLMKNKFVKYMMKYKWFRNLMFKFFIPKRGSWNWPNWVIKSDETRIQAIPQMLAIKTPFQVSEKLDGTSFTATLKKKSKNKYDFIVCSRNVVVGGSLYNKKPKLFYDENFYVEVSNKYRIEDILRQLIGNNDYITLQGEIVGEKIQGNKYNLDGRHFYAFNLITEKDGKINSYSASEILKPYNINWVPLIDDNYILPDTIDELMEFSTGKSLLYDTLREGYVFRDKDNKYSFKCVSNEFLLKHNL